MDQKRKKQFKPRWEEIFTSLGDGIIILNTQKKVTEINPAAERVTGCSAESVLGYPFEEAFRQSEEVETLIQPCFEEVRTTTVRDIPWRMKHAEMAFVDLSVTPLMGDQGDMDGWIVVLRDMTPIKSLEEEVRKSDRLAMMGTLAAGLAHEIKNPLGGIKGAAQLLKREETTPDETQCLDIIIREVDRMDRLIGQLLSFSRPKNPSFESVNLNELLDSIILLQQKNFKDKKIHLVREFDPSLPPIRGDRDQLHQVFLNFIKNALEAISEAYPEGGGSLHLQSRLLTSFKIKGAEGTRPVRMVAAEIRDNGVGISPEDLEKIFTPFFTTKEKGYGLGLPLTQRIIHEHGGVVKFKSEKGKGTTVEVLLKSV